MIEGLVLFLYLPVVSYLWYRFIKNEVQADYKAIIDDGSKDSLKKEWHRKSAVRVGYTSVSLAVPFGIFGWIAFVAAIITLWAVFWRWFDLWLNRKRDLPDEYVGQSSDFDNFFRDFFPFSYERAMWEAKALALATGVVTLFWSLIDYFVKAL